MNYTSIVTKKGDRLDLIAHKAYGDANMVYRIIMANPDILLEAELDGGLTIILPVYEDPKTGNLLPPWATDAEDVTDLPSAVTPGIPVTPAPPAPLSFAQQYPVVEGNKIKFAINKTGLFTWFLKKQNGTIVQSSINYPFTAGFPILTQTLTDGGRYIIEVGTITSAPLTVEGAGAALAFVQTPIVVKEGSAWKLRYSINKTGAYNTLVVNSATSVQVYKQDNFDYTKDFVVTININTVGPYTLKVGTLTANFTIQNETEVTEKPAWIDGVGFRYDANSHEYTKYVDASADVEVRISLTSGGGPNGVNQDGAVWNANTYNNGRNDFVPAGYTERFSFNPASFGAGGLLPGTTYKAWIRRISNPAEVFTFQFTTPIVSTAPGTITVIDLEEPEENPACGRRPTIQDIFSPTSTSLRFLFDGEGVYSLKWKIRDSAGAIIRQGVIVVALDSGTPIFNPSNQPILTYAAIGDGDYTLEIEGNNCSSTPHTMDFTVDDGVIVIPPDSVDQMELAPYYDDGGTSDLKCRVLGAFPITLQVLDGGDDVVYSTSASSNEIEIPDSVEAGLGSGIMKIIATDSTGKTATRNMTKVVRDRRKITHAFISIPNGDTTNHKNAINQGQSHTPPLTMTAVIFGQMNTDADYNAYINTTYVSGGASPHDFDNVIYLAKQKATCKRLKVGIGLVRDSSKMNNGTTRTKFLNSEDLIMRVGGTTPTNLPWLIGQMILSPSAPGARAYAKRQMEAFVRHNYAPIMDGTIALIGMPIGSSGEAEYPQTYHDATGNDEPNVEVRGDFNRACVSKFKQRYPQHANVSDQQLYDAFYTTQQLAMDWKEHHAIEYAEFEAEVFEHVYSIYPEMRGCQFEQIDVGSTVDQRSPRRHTQNMRRRVRKTTGLIKTNDNPHGGNRGLFIADHDTSLSRIFGSDFAAEPSPQNPNYGDPEVRGLVIGQINPVVARGGWISFYDPTYANIQYFLDNSDLVPGVLPKAKLEYQISGSNRILKRHLINISEVFKYGGLDVDQPNNDKSWQAKWLLHKNAESLTHVDTLSFDDLYTGAQPNPDPDPDPGPGPDPEPGSGEWTPVIAHYGLQNLLNVTVTDAGTTKSENWLINMTSTATPNPGYQYWVRFEKVWYKAGSLPTNYQYQSNEPISVQLYIMLTGTDTMYRWANPNENVYIPGFSNPQQGQTMELNSTAAVVVIGFKEA